MPSNVPLGSPLACAIQVGRYMRANTIVPSELTMILFAIRLKVRFNLFQRAIWHDEFISFILKQKTEYRVLEYRAKFCSIINPALVCNCLPSVDYEVHSARWENKYSIASACQTDRFTASKLNLRVICNALRRKPAKATKGERERKGCR